MAPLTSITGTALADTPDSDHDSSSSVDSDSSSWNDDGDQSHGDEDSTDRSELKSFDWRDSHSPPLSHRDSTGSSHGSSDSPGSGSSSRVSTGSALGSATSAAALTKWDKLAQCESTQNWSANTGNGYKGGLQFNDSTWRAYGGTRYAASAHQASRLQQIAVAQKVQQAQGWNAWPSCSRKLGYT
ncbi:MAG: transglycosylase family protein [Pseudonocardia sp.]|nr:transglycosylase family protein [Pseudonocardia sp.]